jgi:mannose-6-phosphate isomerase-like protein (cupin superfamily)
MTTIDEEAMQEQLRAEGFRRIYVWQDGPVAFYPEHAHTTESAHIILEGEMTLTMNSGMRTYRVGERCDVPAGMEHCARMGPHGCRSLIGEK